jgi:hypothetical protein
MPYGSYSEHFRQGRKLMSDAAVPHKVHFTGENSFLRLCAEEGGADTTTCAHWRGLI